MYAGITAPVGGWYDPGLENDDMRFGLFGKIQRVGRAEDRPQYENRLMRRILWDNSVKAFGSREICTRRRLFGEFMTIGGTLNS